MPEARWKLVLGVVAAVIVTATIAELSHGSSELDRVCDNTIQLLAIPLGAVAIVAAGLALRGDRNAPVALAVAAFSVLSVALLNGAGEWGTPLAIAGCVATVSFRPRAPSHGDMDRADDSTS